jgi:DNA polymerase I-like protein with 3'-5' exonuclease and polymerase domains
MQQFISTPDPRYIDSLEEAREVASWLMNSIVGGFDTETTGLDLVRSRIKVFSVAIDEARFAVPIRYLDEFVPWLTSVEHTKVFTNAKFDMHMLATRGIYCRGNIFCTLPMDWLLDENRDHHGLKETAKDHLGLRMTPFKQVFGDVGTINDEVETLGRIVDALDSDDEHSAIGLLVEVGQAEASQEVLAGIKKLLLYQRSRTAMKTTSLVKIARDTGVTTRTAGKSGALVDLARIMDPDLEDIPAKLRDEYLGGVFDDPDVMFGVQEEVLRQLQPQVKIPYGVPALDMLRLIMGDYASLDAWASLRLGTFYEGALSKEYIITDQGEPTSLWDFYLETSMPFTRVLWNMERRGMAIDLEGAIEVGTPLKTDMDRIERDLVSQFGIEFNIRSSDDLLSILYSYDEDNDVWADQFGRPPQKWTKGGASGIKKPSVDKTVLEDLADVGDENAQLVIDHRKSAKLYDTYIKKMPGWVDPYCRVHTTLKQTGTVTQRLSSADPNLQNIPTKGSLGKKIRKLFVAGKWGDVPNYDICLDEVMDVELPDLPADFPMRLIVADYSQLEMCIFAHFSEDPVMINAICGGQDLHCVTTSVAGGLDYDLVKAAKDAYENGTATPEQEWLVEQRSAYKSVGFGLLYGIGAVKLGRQLKLPVESYSSRHGTRFRCPQAEQLIKTYFGVYPGARAFIDNTHAQCTEDLFVTTIAGRMRRLPDIASSDKGVVAMAKRQAVNSRIQGSAADIVNRAMLKCERSRKLRSLGVRMLLQVHDELIFEVPDLPEFVTPAEAEIKRLMSDPFNLRVPIKTSSGTGYNWGESKK